jgi:hypothetical protein
MQAVTDKYMDEKVRSKLQGRLLQRSIKEAVQMGLGNFMNVAINGCASENTIRGPTIKTAQPVIFILIRLSRSRYRQVKIV